MKLSARKRGLSFETDDVIFDRGRNKNIVVSAYPKFAEMRLKGQRQSSSPLRISWAAMYQRAVNVSAAG